MTFSTGVYVRCVLWGLATGAVTGALTGLILVVVTVVSNGDAGGVVGALVAAALLGLLVGTVVAVLPSVLGAGVVVVVLASRHPHPTSENAVRRDLGVLFAAVVGVLDLLLLAAVGLGGKGLASVADSLPFVLAGNALVALVLGPARASITRAWLHA